jgi:MYXO-CTERM domain-containing protein
MMVTLGGVMGASEAQATPEGPPLVRAKIREVPVGAARGVIEQHELRIHGLPVRGAFEAALVSPGGDRRIVAERLPIASPQLRPDEASVAAEAAVEIALAHARPEGGGAPPGDGARLVYLMILDTPVLAWEVDTPLVLSPEPSMITVWVSAATGRVLEELEHVRASKAKVFAENPASTPEPIEVTLSGVVADGPGVPLIGERVQAYNCQLDEPEEIVPWWKEGECYAVRRALSDAQGDFVVPLPDVKYPEQNQDGDDLYAELSMYFHAEKFLDHMAGLGVTSFKCDLSTMLANFRYSAIAVSYPDLSYGPLNNAYYTNQCDAEKGPTMIFGQGSAVDFGFDGDVVYHELGHGMVSHLTPNGLSSRRSRPDASLVDAGGLNEAFADYFSVMVAEDPLLGDYVARFWAGYGEAIRNHETTKVCPSNTIGQVHNDGEPFMAALWAVRKRVGPKLDYVFIEALTRLPNDSDLETAAYTFLEVAEERRAEGEWSAEDMEHLIRALDTRGLFDCPRVITDAEAVEAGRSMYLRPKSTSVTPFFPGPMQLRHEIPQGSDNLIVRFRLSPRGTSTGNPITSPVGAIALIKRADEPIQFQYDLVAAEQTGDPSKVQIREITRVSGDWDLERAATLIVGSENQLVIRGMRPGEVVYLTLVNTETTEAVAGSVSVVSVPTELLDQGSIPSQGGGDGDDEEPDDAGAGGAELGEPMTSCACSSEGDGAGGLASLALLSAPWWRRRRRCDG